MNNYFDISINGDAPKRAHNQVLGEVGQAFSLRRNFTDFLALGSGTEIRDGVRLGQPLSAVYAVVTDMNTDEWEGRLFVTRSAEVSFDEAVTIREIGFTHEDSADPRLVTHAVFDEPIEVRPNDTVTVTAFLFLDLERNTQMRLTRGDNFIAKAMLGVAGLPNNGWGIWRSTVNLPNANFFRRVPEGETVTPVDTMLRIDGGLAWRFWTGEGNPNFEMILCQNRVPQARINYRSHLMSLGSKQVICTVNGALEVSAEGQIFERMVSLMRSNQNVPYAVSRFSYHLDEADSRNMPVKFSRDCRAVTDFSGRYLGVVSEKAVKVFDVTEIFRPIASQNIEVERGSAVGIASDGTVFASMKGRLTAYKRTDGGYFQTASGSVILDGEVKRVMVSSVSPMLVCVETDRGVKFFSYRNTPPPAGAPLLERGELKTDDCYSGGRGRPPLRFWEDIEANISDNSAGCKCVKTDGCCSGGQRNTPPSLEVSLLERGEFMAVGDFDSAFEEIFSIVSDNPVFLHQPDGNRIQFFTDLSGSLEVSGEFVGAVRRDFTPEFVTALRSQAGNINVITRMRSSGGILLAEVESENKRFLIAANSLTAILLPAAYEHMTIFGHYLLTDYGDKYEIFYISAAAGRCVSVQILEKGAGIAGIEQCGQWVVVLFRDGTTRLFASRFDSLDLRGNFEAGQAFTATVFARSGFNRDENVEIRIGVE